MQNRKIISLVLGFFLVLIFLIGLMDIIDLVFSILISAAIILLYVIYLVIDRPEKEEFRVAKKEGVYKECPVCHTLNNENRKYCKKCNTMIQNITCPVCHEKNPFDATYCKSCDSILQNKTRH